MTDLDSSFHCFNTGQWTQFLDYWGRKDIKADAFQKNVKVN